MDYAYLSNPGNRDDVVTLVVARDRRTRSLCASALARKGSDKFAIQVIIDFVRHLGWRRIILKSDSEESIMALKGGVRAGLDDVDVAFEESPRGDHKANGETENAVKQVKGQIRVLYLALMARMGGNVMLPYSHPLVQWLPRHAATVVSRYRVGEDGFTAEQRRSGKRWRQPAIPFGSKVLVRLPALDAKKRDLEARMVEAVYVGHASRSGTVLALTPDGAIRGVGVARFPEDVSWPTAEELSHLKGLPWAWKESSAAERPAEAGVGDAAVYQIPERGPIHRSFYVTRRDIEKHGATPGCAACVQVATRGRTTVGHTNACRERILERMKESEDPRMEAHAAKRQRPGGRAGAEAQQSPSQAAAQAGAEAQQSPSQAAEAPAAAPAGSHDPQEDAAMRPEEHGSADPPEMSEPMEVRTPRGVSRGVEEAPDSPSKRTKVSEGSPASPVAGGQEPATSVGDPVSPSVAAKRPEVVGEPDPKRSRVGDDVDLALVAFSELFNPRNFTAIAPKFHLNPGVAADIRLLNESGKPYDLVKVKNQEEYIQALHEQDPYLVVGAPPCTTFSSMRNLTVGKRDPEVVAWEEQIGMELLTFAVRCYREQRRRGRLFLHEHPWGASSWRTGPILSLMEEDDVIAVRGDMCAWGMTAPDDGGVQHPCLKPTGWLTNSPELAAVLSRRCPGCEYHQHLIGGRRTEVAAEYPPRLVTAILRTLKDYLDNHGEINILEGTGPVPESELQLWHPVDSTGEHFWDDVRGGWLDAGKVKAARKVELEWMMARGVFEVVELDEAYRQWGRKPIPLRWVDTNKGDEQKENYRSRLVVKEVKRAKAPEERMSTIELFSSTPPLEAVRLLLSLMVTERTSRRGGTLKLACWDVSRAHLYGEVQRLIFVDLPEGLEVKGNGGGKRYCAKLRKAMYGCQDSSKTWQDDHTRRLSAEGHLQGKSSGSVYYHKETGSTTVVHGDDFLTLADQEAIDGMDKKLKAWYEVRKTGNLGPEPRDDKEIVYLNRVIRFDDRTGFVELEPDMRHVEMLKQEFGLDNSRANGLDVPITKATLDELEAEEREPTLDDVGIKQFRSAVMRCSYLSLDRPDIGEAVKQLSRRMKTPKPASMRRLKRVVRYLVKYPCLVTVFRRQDEPEAAVTALVDSDFAGCQITRRSSMGLVIMHGRNVVKTQAVLQSTISLSSGEAEYYALVKGVAAALGVRALMMDMGRLAETPEAKDAAALTEDERKDKEKDKKKNKKEEKVENHGKHDTGRERGQPRLTAERKGGECERVQPRLAAFTGGDEGALDDIEDLTAGGQDEVVHNNTLVTTDSSAAKGFAQRRGLGRVKHVQVRYLWIQERLARREATLRWIPTARNVADILTKPVSGTLMRKHLRTMGFSFRERWSLLHRRAAAAS